METEEREKRKVHRSPSYPAFSLGEAIEKTDSIYKHEKRSATTADVIASHIGYSQAKGPGGRAVSALRQYGLVEETGGKCRISELGYTLVHYERSSTEWKQAAVEASRKPTLFRQLLEEYQDELPSDATLRHDLLKRDFNPASIPDVVSIFRSTMSLAQTGDSVHNGSRDEEQTMQTEHQETEAMAKMEGSERHRGLPISPSLTRKPVQLAMQVLAISIPRNLSVDVSVKGDELKREDLAKIKSQFNRWIEGLEEAFE